MFEKNIGKTKKMKINEPKELRDVELVVKKLSELSYIELEAFGNGEYNIMKKSENKPSKFDKWLGFNWNLLGQILLDKKYKIYSFCDEDGSLKSILKLNDWDKIKEVMEILQ